MDVDQGEDGVNAIPRMLCRLLADRRGAAAVEYAVIAALIVVAMIGGVAALGGGTGGMWTDVSTEIADAS